MTQPERFDLVVLGPTGATGRQVVRYLASRLAASELTWAVAGRDRPRIDAVLADAGVEVPVLPVDLTDTAATGQLAQRARVVVNLVGPYARLGLAVYQACADHGTHQVDVCGEIDWLADLSPQLDARARDSGARLLHTAGFEALPFDLMSIVAAETAERRWEEPLADLDVAISVERDPPIVRLHDLLSGGTLASGTEALRRGAHRATTDARVLDPEPHDALPFELGARRHRGTGAWIGPLVPSPYINPAIVHRTAGERARARPGLFSRDYRFREGLVAAGLYPGTNDEMGAELLATGHATGSLLTAAPPAWRSLVADVIDVFGPAPGAGPDNRRLDGWTWRLDGRATTEGGHEFDVVARGDGHPGYRSTANLVGEAAVLLAEGHGSGPGGLRTPGLVFDAADIDRFRAAGLVIDLAFDDRPRSG